MNGACRAFNHADRVSAVQAGVGNHVLAMHRAVSNESRIVVVCCGTGSYAVVAPSTAIEVDNHRRRATDVPTINQKVEQVIGNWRNRRCRDSSRWCGPCRRGRSAFQRTLLQQQFFSQSRWDDDDIQITDRGQ